MTNRKSILCAAAFLMTTTVATADISIWLDPIVSDVDLGESVTVDLMAAFDEPVMGWGLDLMIEEPTPAAWTNTAIDENWDPADTIDGDGLAGLRFPHGLSGEVRLATLTFEGLALGTTILTPGIGLEEDEGILLEAGGQASDIQFAPMTLTVVPEPTTVLLGLGLIGLYRRR